MSPGDVTPDDTIQWARPKPDH
eukprot:gene26919-biopygen17500